MSLSYNDTELQSIIWNGDDVQSVTMDGVEVWSAHPPFLVRMRYDANEATHVKDLVGGYTITTDTGGAVPAAADPFGGNNALDISGLQIKYGGSKEISGLKSTVVAWVKFVSGYDSRNNTFVNNEDYGGYNGRLCHFTDGGYPEVQTGFLNYAGVKAANRISGNVWHYCEFSTDNNLVRIFVDGTKVLEQTLSSLTSYPLWKNANGTMQIGGFDWNSGWNKFTGYIYDFCILNGVWHTENYNVPTAYI